MYKIESITNDAKQKQTIPHPTTGELIQFSMYFIEMQQGWFIKNLTYLNFVLNGVRISNNPDILYQWRNLIPFGLACFSPLTRREPTLQDDFVSGSATLYLLTEDEVDSYTEFITGQI